MKKMHMFLAVLLCVTMIFSMSSFALATEGGMLLGSDEISIIDEVVCTCGAEEGEAHAEGCALYVAPEEPELPAGGEPDEVVCTCGATEGEAHTEECPLYVVPEEYEPPVIDMMMCTCNAAEGEAHAEDCVLYVAPAAVCEECGMTDGHTEDCSQYDVEGRSSVFEQLWSASSLNEFWSVMMAEENREAIFQLTAEEINTLIDYIAAIHAAIADPTDDETYTFQELTETLSYLPAMECPECGEFGGHADDCIMNIANLAGTGTIKGTVTGTAFKEARNASNVVKLTADTTLTSQVNVNAGETLIIDLNGYALISKVDGDFSMIYCDGTLTVKDSDPDRQHKGSLEKVTHWLDKRANYSKYGKQYDNNTYYYDRYDQVTTPEEELWKYDKTGSVVVKGGIITGSSIRAYGGAVYVRNGGVFNLQGGTIVGNATYRKIEYDASTSTNLKQNEKGQHTGLFNTFGGAVYVKGSTFNMSGGTICYNWADYYGGGVCLDDDSTMNMTSGIITENCAQGSGGGIGVRDGSTLNLGTDKKVDYKKTAAPVISYNKTFDVNYTGGGGGIEVTSATLNYEVGSIMYNRASGSGGGIYCYRGGSVNASSANSNIANNYAGGSGGAIFLQYGDVNLDGCILNNNQSGGSAGAIGLRVGNFTMTGGEIKNNVAGSSGGAVYVTAQNNITPHGDPGDLGCSASINGTVISGNRASSSGGAVFVSVANSSDDCSVDLTNCQITGNKASVQGGAVYLCGGTLTVSGANTLVHDNTAPKGGAFYIEESNKTSTSLTKNNYIYKVIKDGWEPYNTLTEEDVQRITDPAIAIKTAVAHINAGTFTDNKATNGNGGLLFVTGTKAEVYLNDGLLQTNTASKNGGAFSVNGGNVTMSGGKMNQNSATVLGGAVYVSGGNFTMTGGEATSNQAEKGGAVYITGGNFDMISGSLLNNGGQNTEYGGAVYVDGGNITVGVKGCKGGDEGTKHTKSHKDKVHPIIKGNTAQYGGAFAVRGQNNGSGQATKGIVNVYCSHILNNTSDNAGTGQNIFMDGGGIVHYLDSAVIGAETDHGIVSIGGQLEVVSATGATPVNLIYHSNFGDDDTWNGTAPENYYINMPYCPQEWQTEQAAKGLVFVGWSDVQLDSSVASAVRDESNYYPIGTAKQIKGTKAFYAIWAPINNNISYAYTVDGTNVIQIVEADREREIGFTGHNTYTYQNTKYPSGIPDASRPGYTFAGWLMYSDTSKISNWDADPLGVSSNNVQKIAQIKKPSVWNGDIDRNFGDIILVAVFEPAYTDLKITHTRWNMLDVNQTFLFNITGQPDNESLGKVDLTVAILGDGSVIIDDIPVGTYTVTELNGWSWRYDISKVFINNVEAAAGTVRGTVTISDPAVGYEVKFENSISIIQWLDGNSYTQNVFDGTSVERFDCVENEKKKAVLS